MANQTGDQAALNLLAKAVASISALDGISNNEPALAAIDMYARSIATFVNNAALERLNNPPVVVEEVPEVLSPAPVEGIDTSAASQPENQ